MAAVTADNRLKVDLGGDITISGISIDSIVIQDTVPTSSARNNPAGSLVYSGNLIGSIVTFIGGSRFVNRLGYSGNVLVTIGSNVAY